MDVEGQRPNQRQEEEAPPQMSKGLWRALLALNLLLMALGNTGGPLLLRLYFRSGGQRQWLSSWLGTAAWPLILLALLLSYLYRGRRLRHHQQYLDSSTRSPQLFFITRPLALSCAALGMLTGLDDFLYAYGLSFLPVSTSALLISTQLAFTAFFAFLLVKQRFTPYSVNSVALLTAGASVIGLHAGSDQPEGVTRKEYYAGFVLTLGAAALYGMILPLVELLYSKAKQAITYTLVMEMQLVIAIFASSFCIVGMAVNRDFQAIPKEAEHFKLGEVRYYVVLVWSAIFWQFFFLGTVGVIFCVNTLLAGVLIAVFIPVTELLGVLFFKEKFSGEKCVALVLALWGLASYSYGEYTQEKKKRKKMAALSSINTQAADFEFVINRYTKFNLASLRTQILMNSFAEIDAEIY